MQSFARFFFIIAGLSLAQISIAQENASPDDLQSAAAVLDQAGQEAPPVPVPMSKEQVDQVAAAISDVQREYLPKLALAQQTLEQDLVVLPSEQAKAAVREIYFGRGSKALLLGAGYVSTPGFKRASQEQYFAQALAIVTNNEGVDKDYQKVAKWVRDMRGRARRVNIALDQILSRQVTIPLGFVKMNIDKSSCGDFSFQLAKRLGPGSGALLPAYVAQLKRSDYSRLVSSYPIPLTAAAVNVVSQIKVICHLDSWLPFDGSQEITYDAKNMTLKIFQDLNPSYSDSKYYLTDGSGFAPREMIYSVILDAIKQGTN